jgi:hypothetical protein
MNPLSTPPLDSALTILLPCLAINVFNDANAPYIILGLGAFIVLYIVIRPMMRRKNDPFQKPFAARSLTQQRSVERQMESLLVELSEMSRQMSAQLDTRATRLELLIKEADEKIEAIQRATLESPQRSAREQFSDQHSVSADDTRHTMRHITGQTAEHMFSEPIAEKIDPAHAQVYALVDAGKTVPQIAAEVSRPSGEIELILALRSRA